MCALSSMTAVAVSLISACHSANLPSSLVASPLRIRQHLILALVHWSCLCLFAVLVSVGIFPNTPVRVLRSLFKQYRRENGRQTQHLAVHFIHSGTFFLQVCPFCVHCTHGQQEKRWPKTSYNTGSIFAQNSLGNVEMLKREKLMTSEQITVLYCVSLCVYVCLGVWWRAVEDGRCC